VADDDAAAAAIKRGSFRGAAWHYARFRPPYPHAFFDLLRDRYSLGAESRVLDLAAGTGLVTLPLARIVGEVVAVDLEPEMLAELTAVAPDNVRVVQLRAEEVGPELGRFDLATIGRAFHWMERDVVLERLHPIARDVVIAGDPQSEGEPWDTISVIAGEFLGDRRPRPSGERWVDLVRRSAYGRCEELVLAVERTWTVDELVGWTFSLSSASPSLLGERTGEFEQRLRERLNELGGGPWIEHATFDVLLT
jgi:SAM-dependent methyltransferase